MLCVGYPYVHEFTQADVDAIDCEVAEPGFYFCVHDVMHGPYKVLTTAYKKGLAHRAVERAARDTVWYYDSRLLADHTIGGAGFYYEYGPGGRAVMGPYETKELAQAASKGSR